MTSALSTTLILQVLEDHRLSPEAKIIVTWLVLHDGFASTAVLELLFLRSHGMRCASVVVRKATEHLYAQGWTTNGTSWINDFHNFSADMGVLELAWPIRSLLRCEDKNIEREAIAESGEAARRVKGARP
jgi:hypothetical protein